MHKFERENNWLVSSTLIKDLESQRFELKHAKLVVSSHVCPL